MGVKAVQLHKTPCSAGSVLTWSNALLLLSGSLNKFEQEVLHFHFVVGPTNFVDSPATGLYLLGAQGLSILLHC